MAQTENLMTTTVVTPAKWRKRKRQREARIAERLQLLDNAIELLGALDAFMARLEDADRDRAELIALIWSASSSFSNDLHRTIEKARGTDER